jgi:DNA polymerase-3 subunit epsilon
MTSVRDIMPPEPEPFTGTPWFEQRFVSLDLETTHPEPDVARIVTASVLEIGGRRPTVSRSWLVDPDIEIPAGAVAVHGITTEQAREAGELAGDAVPAIIETLAARPGDCPIAVFNSPYDLTVLDREARRCDVTPLQDRGPLLVIDPLVIDKHLHRYRPGSRKLGPMAEWYRVVTGADGHDADYDARLAAFLARRLCRDALVIRRDEWEEQPLQAEWDRIRCDAVALHAAQAGWYGFQARGLAAHFREQGKRDEADRVREDWPLVPFEGEARS